MVHLSRCSLHTRGRTGALRPWPRWKGHQRPCGGPRTIQGILFKVSWIPQRVPWVLGFTWIVECKPSASAFAGVLEGLLNPQLLERWNEYWRLELSIYVTTRLISKDSNGKFWKLEPCEGEPARVSGTFAPAFYLGTIGVSRKVSTTNINLPPTTEGTMFVVSRAVAEANRGRKDLMFPGPQYFTDDGVKYCVGLEIC